MQGEVIAGRRLQVPLRSQRASCLASWLATGRRWSAITVAGKLKLSAVPIPIQRVGVLGSTWPCLEWVWF